MMDLKNDTLDLLHRGTVIPAHPLALTQQRTLDEKRQRQLTRYYLECGAGGIAIGVHTTQFEIRDPKIGLYEPVLRIVADEINQAELTRPFIRVAGIVGKTEQALREAEIAKRYGYELGLLSMGGLQDYTEAQLIKRAEQVSQQIGIFGFYLQPAVGGRILSYEFWKDFAALPNLHAIKIAAFNRYQTLDVVRAVCLSSRRDQIALYTGNDDNIVHDLITPYRFEINGERIEKRFIGGLLGHWAVWTKKAVELLEEIHSRRYTDQQSFDDLLSTGIKITDMNSAIFDPAHNFHGCIAGIHEVLRRQGLLEGMWTLNPGETLSPGQAEEIDRVTQAYPEWIDDDFVAEFLKRQ